MKKSLFQKLNNVLGELQRGGISQYSYLLVINIILLISQVVYLSLRFSYLNTHVPFWFTQPWGDAQLATRDHLFYIPLISLLLILAGIVMYFLVKKLYVRYFYEIIVVILTLAVSVLTYSLFRIIHIASVPFPSMIDPLYFDFIPAFLMGFLLVYFLAPKFIGFAKERGLITNPDRHSHPAMILTKPSARGGGVIFTIGFVITVLLFVPLSLPTIGILIIASLLAILGLLDDHQNTHNGSKLSFLESPFIRLFLLLLIVAPVVLFNITIGYISNPFGGILNLNGNTLLSIAVTIFWIIWILNILSWSNGIDGQYCGIIGIASLVVAILALRFSPLLPSHISYAKMAIIAAGSSFGLLRYTWHPSKVLWGFSAMSAGFILASLSILISSKITVSIMIILIPFLDALVTVIRRMLQRKNPLKGDKGHLHHLLMERGWSVKKIAVFYWVTTAIFGLIGALATEAYTIQITLVISGIVAFFIILLNLRSIAGKQVSPLVD